MSVIIMAFNAQSLTADKFFYDLQGGKIWIILNVKLARFSSNFNLLDALEAFDVIYQTGGAIKAFPVFPD
jgi:hypothetical protein